jgi:DNA-binding NtrC family response regulator
LNALSEYHWPGNVRQLRNCLERAVLLSNENLITLNELPPEVARRAPFAGPLAFAAQGSQSSGGGSDAAAATAQNSYAPTAPASLRESERQQILAALEQTNWHRGKTAELLGISPSTLYRRLRDYNLDKRN